MRRQELDSLPLHCMSSTMSGGLSSAQLWAAAGKATRARNSIHASTGFIRPLRQYPCTARSGLSQAMSEPIRHAERGHTDFCAPRGLAGSQPIIVRQLQFELPMLAEVVTDPCLQPPSDLVRLCPTEDRL